MRTVLQTIGLVLVVEGLAFALAPKRIEEALMLLSRLSPDVRRAIGLAALALGVMLVAMARALHG